MVYLTRVHCWDIGVILTMCLFGVNCSVIKIYHRVYLMLSVYCIKNYKNANLYLYLLHLESDLNISIHCKIYGDRPVQSLVFNIRN